MKYRYHCHKNQHPEKGKRLTDKKYQHCTYNSKQQKHPVVSVFISKHTPEGDHQCRSLNKDSIQCTDFHATESNFIKVQVKKGLPGSEGAGKKQVEKGKLKGFPDSRATALKMADQAQCFKPLV